MRRLIAFGFAPLALFALAVLTAAPPAHALAKNADFTLTNYGDIGDLFSLADMDLTVPAIIDRLDNVEPYHEPENWQFGIGHPRPTESLRHDALAFALIGNASHAPEVASPPSIAG